MEGINNKIKTMLRQTYGLRDERYFMLKRVSGVLESFVGDLPLRLGRKPQFPIH
jgi:hypothetical protein